MRERLLLSVVGLSSVLGACAAAPPPQAATARTEIVIDEPEVVRVHAATSAPGGLPPLPVAFERTSPAFQRAFALAQPLLDAPPPAAAPDDSAAYRGWLDAEFKPWLVARGQAVAQANAALGKVANGSVDERVVGGALVGLMDAHVHGQLIAVPAPPELRTDEKLLRIYQNEINSTAAGWLEQSLISLRDCANHAARQADPVFGAWLGLCQDHMAMLQQAQASAAALAESVAREREADRIAAEGERPPGPTECWTPPSAAARPAADEAGPALSPRDLRYGVLDATTRVRVSTALAASAATANGSPTTGGTTTASSTTALDASPLLTREVQARLARCFAQNVREDAAITLAIQATVSVQASGRVAAITLSPETSDATAPSKPLLRCVQQALTQRVFGADPARGAVELGATYCMRRD